MSKLEQAPIKVWEMGAAIIKQYHKDLNTVGVKLEYLFAYAPTNEAGEKKGAALKSHGYPCSGAAGIINLEGRVMGRQDGKVILDGDGWGRMSEQQQNALLDHEISHFLVARNLEGEAIYDDCGRPKLKMRLHDFQAGWFHDIAARHGAASAEMTQAALLFQECGQVYFPLAGVEGKRPLKVLPASAVKLVAAKAKAKPTVIIDGDSNPDATDPDQEN